eukprot:gene7399-biopygen1493
MGRWIILHGQVDHTGRAGGSHWTGRWITLDGQVDHTGWAGGSHWMGRDLLPHCLSSCCSRRYDEHQTAIV